MLKSKFTVVNRAPIMMAWSFVVAERLGFQREEALSIGEHPRLCTATAHSPHGYGAATQPHTPLIDLAVACSFCVYGDERNFQGGIDRSLRRSKEERR